MNCTQSRGLSLDKLHLDGMYYRDMESILIPIDVQLTTLGCAVQRFSNSEQVHHSKPEVLNELQVVMVSNLFASHEHLFWRIGEVYLRR
jgi:hypothetical protein